MSKLTELKELYVKLGGKLEDLEGVNTVGKMLNKIQKTKLGVELPGVEELDNGKLLAVSDRSWKKACLSVSLDEDYILSIGLEDENGTAITTKTIDLPLESMFVDVELLGDNLIITLQNGNTVTVSLADLIGGISLDTLTYEEETGDLVEREEIQNLVFDDYPTSESTQQNPENLLPINDGFRLYPAEGQTIADYEGKVFVSWYDANGNYVNANDSGELYPRNNQFFEIKKNGQFSESKNYAARYVAFNHNAAVQEMQLVYLKPDTETKEIAVADIVNKNDTVYKHKSINQAEMDSELYEIPEDTVGILITETSKDLQITLWGEFDSLEAVFFAKTGDMIPIDPDDISAVTVKKSEHYGESPGVGETTFKYAWVTAVKEEHEAVQELLNAEPSACIVNYASDATASNWTKSMAFAEIMEKINAGLIPIANLDIPDLGITGFKFNLTNANSNRITFTFVAMESATRGLIMELKHNSDDTISQTTKHFTLT